MKIKIILVLILLGTMILPISTMASPGDGFSDPEIANLGANTATLVDTTHEEHFFSFTGSSTYLFSMVGPEDTDFDMMFFDSTETFITSSTSINYPEEETLDVSGQIFIRVYIFTGDGEFTLTISEDVSEPGNMENPETASLGVNTGTLSDSFDQHYFEFSGTGFYEFSLDGPVDTDFDMNIYDSNGFSIDGAYGTSYPDTVTVEVIDSVIVEVYSFSGSGDFDLTISIGEEPVDIETVSFSNELSEGDIFEWFIEEEGLGENATVQIEVISDERTLSEDSVINIFEITFEEDGTSETEQTSFVFPFIIYTSMTYSDGTSTSDLRDVLEFLFGGDSGISYSESDGQLTASMSGEFSITYDISSGVLLGYSSTSSSSDVSATLISSSIDLENDEGEDDPFLNLPFNFSYFFVFLIAIPIVRRYSENL